MQTATAPENDYARARAGLLAAETALEDQRERVSHFYTGSAIMAPDQYRGIDLMTPVWHLLDLLPGGRGDWMPKLDYG